MKRYVLIARVLVLLAPLVALWPLARVVADWVEVSRVLTEPALDAPARGFDWVLWQEDDGIIVAAYVFPRGPGYEAGLRSDDVFYMLEDQQLFNAEDLKRAVEGIPPGSVRSYYVLREAQFVEAEVQFSRYPTFLYPLSGSLWMASIWGFTLGAFIHLLCLFIVGPLAPRSGKAAFSLGLILVSSLWIFGNLLRLLLVQVLGPPIPGGAYDQVFQALTLIGLVGWIGFPVLLLRKVLGDAGLTLRKGLGWLYLLIYVTPAVLGILALAATVRPQIGPFTLDGLIAPLLFYACCYIAAAAALVLAHYLEDQAMAEARLGGWSRAGSLITFLLALLAALSVLGVVPIFGAVDDATVGWLIVGTQLLSIAPVLLVSVATLKHGKVDEVLSRGLTYLTVLGLIFLVFVGGLSLMDPYLQRTDAARNVVAGLYVVMLLIIFERLARRLRVYATRVFATERQEARQTLSRFQEQMRTLLSHEALLHQTVRVVGEAFGARSARLFFRPQGPGGPWLSSAYHPEPPFLNEQVVSMVWPHLQREGRIWAINPELNESTLPDDLSKLLRQRGAALVIPILGDSAPIGVLVMGPKKRRRAVYNLEDMDMLRSISGQLALAVERLHLVERERELVRQSAEAQLVALRAQINPHFLFNALNTIIALIEERPEEAEETVEHLAAIFRHTLQAGGRPFVSLEEEFALVSHYLSIEQARFGEKLTVERAYDPALRAHPVPAFAVQTLVENAVKHGLAQRREGGRVRLDARRGADGLVEVVVADTGVGIPALFETAPNRQATDDFFGIGLGNVAARLKRLYGRGDLLRHTSTANGTTVQLRLPVPDRPLGALRDETGDGAGQEMIRET